MILLALLLAAAEPEVRTVDCQEIRQVMLDTREVLGMPMSSIDAIYERCLRDEAG